MDTSESPLLQRVLALPCSSCGSELTYSAEKKRIFCKHCAYEEEVNRANDLVKELNLKEALVESGTFSPEEIGQKVFDCGNCGSKIMLPSDQVKLSCSFCGSKKINLEAFDHNFIQPAGIIPFEIPESEADSKFDAWIKKGWFHPLKLKKLASKKALTGIYIPFWTFDTQAEVQYKGEAGYHYYITETVRTGKNMSTRQVQKTRWEYKSGHFSHFFDDILVVAADGLGQSLVEKILPYNLQKVVNYDPRLMAGWESQIYGVGLQAGHEKAEVIIDRKTRDQASARIGGDTQRNVSFQSQKFNQTFKHIYLPVWLAAYTYMDKTYQFAINGQTGKINGKKPVSVVKIAFAILLFVAFLLALYFWKISVD